MNTRLSFVQVLHQQIRIWVGVVKNYTQKYTDIIFESSQNPNWKSAKITSKHKTVTMGKLPKYIKHKSWAEPCLNITISIYTHFRVFCAVFDRG